MGKTITTIDGRKFRRISRWIKIRQNYNPTVRNSLWDYVEDENGYRPYQDKFSPVNGLCLNFFEFRGRKYAISQFYGLGSIFVSEPVAIYREHPKDKDFQFIGTVDMDGNLFDPYYAEFDEYCENVRIYERA